MGRNAFGLALLVGLALAGCSGQQKEAKLAESKAAALRARTDSLRKVRHLADSLAQIRYVACMDSVRTEMTKPPVVVKKTKAKKQKPPAPPSEERIQVQAKSTCEDSGVPPTAVAVARAAVKDTVRTVATDTARTVARDTARADSMPSGTDQTAWADSVRKAKEMEMARETFAYSGAARDPFNSLLNMSKSGPELADIQLVGIYQNLRTPSGSVAVFREKDGGKRHKLRAGDQVGRSRLVQIRERDVVFMIEDFGFERQETLSLRKQEDVTP